LPLYKDNEAAVGKGKGEGTSVETKSLADLHSKLAKEHVLQGNDVLATETIHFLSLIDIEEQSVQVHEPRG
jgi:hypothetical protein